MVRNYRLRNIYYKSAKISEERTLDLLFPILMGTSYKSLSRLHGTSNYTARSISNALIHHLSRDAHWMENLLDRFKERFDLLETKNKKAETITAYIIAERIKDIYKEYYHYNTVLPKSLEDPKSIFEAAITGEKQSFLTSEDIKEKQEHTSKMVSGNSETIRRCLDNCPIGPSITEIRNEYGELNLPALINQFRTQNHKHYALSKPYIGWSHDEQIGKYIKRPLHGLDTRLKTRFERCKHCPAAGLKSIPAFSWMLLSSFLYPFRKDVRDSEYMSILFIALLAPIYFGLYIEMYAQCYSSYHLSKKDHDADGDQYNKRWLETFLISMRELDDSITSQTAAALFNNPLQDTRPKKKSRR